ncbi:MAG TPA: hypothetical protein VNS32_03740 [Flavisolibacter sp.]|nr:hypothetical protein [Flavisolibacter sp.]
MFDILYLYADRLKESIAALLRKNNTIRKLLAIILLMLFAISAVPKAYFHDLIADHKDVSFCSEVHKTPCAHKQGYNCHFDDLVVHQPFLLPDDQPVARLRVFSSLDLPQLYTSSTQAFFFHTESRGPPQA